VKRVMNGVQVEPPIIPGPSLALQEHVHVPPADTFRHMAFDTVLPSRPLTEREKRILRLVCDGLTNAEIATRLGLAPDTVKAELKRIFRKIEVRNRTQAAMHLVRQGLL
jgi:DNA-binding NarL/FixJ family response regulator